MPTYLFLDLGALIIPLIFSFHPKLRFYKEWRYYIPAILATMLLFILWDVWFAQESIWGFNENYLLGPSLFGLPLEEWLFFICIPYACLFTHHCLGILLPSFHLNHKYTRLLAIILLVIWTTWLVLYWDRSYTRVDVLFAIPVMLFAVWRHPLVLSRFFTTYLFILAPFILVNGMLTGALHPEPIVWYDDAQNLGIRFFMPIEDYSYAFSLLLLPLLMVEQFKK